MGRLLDEDMVINALQTTKFRNDLFVDRGYARAISIIKELPIIQQEKAQLSKESTTSDLISRQAAIDAASSLCDDCDSDYCGSCRVNYPGEKDVIKALKDLPPAQPEPPWIPVSERLPETEKFVLASLTGKYRNITFEHSCEIADYADGEWCVYAYPHMSVEKCAELIEAWMPLPKIYNPNNE